MRGIAALCVGLPLVAGIGAVSPACSAEVRDFYIKTVHIDGTTSTKGDADHKAEPFPTAPMPEGGGLVLSKPDEAGKWRMRAFAFEPAQIVVKAGEPIRLHFVGIQGMSHSIHVEGDGSRRALHAHAREHAHARAHAGEGRHDRDRMLRPQAVDAGRDRRAGAMSSRGHRHN